MIGRRKALFVGLGVAAAAPAQAWTVRTLSADSPTAKDYTGRCMADPFHPKLTPDQQAAPEGEQSAWPQCPLCGCRYPPVRG